jgi:hypothetical protein
VIATLALALVPTLAPAHQKTFGGKLITVITFGGPTGDTFSGTVTVRGGCAKQRLVRVIFKSGGNALVGTDRTNSRGRWLIDPTQATLAPGDYVARVKRRVIRRPGHRHVCLPLNWTGTIT